MASEFGEPNQQYLLFPALVNKASADGLRPTMHLGTEPDAGVDMVEHAYLATRKLGDYCVDNQIADVVLPGDEARLMWIGLHTYLKLAHPFAKLPDIHFVNTSTFEQEVTGHAFRPKPASLQLAESRSSLLDKKDQPVLVAMPLRDETETPEIVAYSLAEMGFEDVRTGVLADRLANSDEPQLDFTYTDTDQYLSDCPFGVDEGLAYGRGDLYAKRTDPKSERRELTEDRNTIIRTFTRLHNVYNGEIGE